MTLTGSGFGTDMSKTVVNIGSFDCTVTSQIDTTVQCSYDPLPAGDYTVRLTTEHGKRL